jgi:large subunit ribosomal protein L6
LGTIIKKKSKTINLSFDTNMSKLCLLNDSLKQKHFYLAIINKIIFGVLKGFTKKLNIIGVGYKAVIENKRLVLKLGYSHNVLYNIPNEISIKILNQKTLTLLILGSDLQKVNQVAAEIRLLRPAEPYKGKGIKYFNENIKRKEGKKSNV